MAGVSLKASVVKFPRLPFLKPEAALDMCKDLAAMNRLDIQEGIKNSVDMNNQPFKALSPKTIERKRKPHIVLHPGKLAIPAEKPLSKMQAEAMKRGATSFVGRKGFTKKGLAKLKAQQARYIAPYPEKPLVDSGNLLFNQSEVKVGKKSAQFTIGPTRADAAEGLIEQGFNFWGVSVRMVEKIQKYLRSKGNQQFTMKRVV